MAAGPSALLTSAAVRALEARLRGADRSHANDLLVLLQTCSADAADHPARLAALQACRALFHEWAECGELSLRATEVDETGGGLATPEAALRAYQSWLRGNYALFVAALRKLLHTPRLPLSLRVPARQVFGKPEDLAASHEVGQHALIHQ